MCEIWDDTFINLIELYKKEFYAADTETYLKLLANSTIRVHVLCESYAVLVKTKRIPPIESIAQEEKLEIWNEAKRLSDNQDKDWLRMVSKVLYGMGQYVQI